MGVRQERVPDYLAEAQKLGDWDSRRGINRKDGAKEDREVFAGSDWWRNYDERQAQQPAVKQGGEPATQPDTRPESQQHTVQAYDAIRDETESLAARLRNMPTFSQEQAIAWTRRVTDSHDKKWPPEFIFGLARRLNHIRQAGAYYEGASQT